MVENTSKKIGNPTPDNSNFVFVPNENNPTNPFIKNLNELGSDSSTRSEFNRKTLKWSNDPDNFKSQNIEVILGMLGEGPRSDLSNQLSAHREYKSDLYPFDDSTRETLFL